MFKTYSNLPSAESSVLGLMPWQKAFIVFVIGLISTGLYIFPIKTGIIFLGFISALYVLDVFFHLFLIIKSLRSPSEIKISQKEFKSLKKTVNRQ